MRVRLRDAFLAFLLLCSGALQPPELAGQTILNVERQRLDDNRRLVAVVYLQPDLAAPADYPLLSDLSLR